MRCKNEGDKESFIMTASAGHLLLGLSRLQHHDLHADIWDWGIN